MAFDKKTYMQEWRASNKDKRAIHDKTYYENHKAVISVKSKEYHIVNRTRDLSYKKQWKIDNADKVNANNANRRAAKLQRTPRWSNLEEIEEYYEQAKYITESSGTPQHVDHVIPLQGERVSGLHVSDNLCILPAAENLSKSNRYEVS